MWEVLVLDRMANVHRYEEIDGGGEELRIYLSYVLYFFDSYVHFVFSAYT